MATLGFNADRLRRDLKAIEQAGRLETEAAADTPELQEQYQAAADELTAHLDATDRIVKEREQERQRLDLAAYSLRVALDRARNARRKLPMLRRQHAELFGESAPEPARERPAGMVPGPVPDFRVVGRREGPPLVQEVGFESGGTFYAAARSRREADDLAEAATARRATRARARATATGPVAVAKPAAVGVGGGQGVEVP